MVKIIRKDVTTERHTKCALCMEVDVNGRCRSDGAGEVWRKKKKPEQGMVFVCVFERTHSGCSCEGCDQRLTVSALNGAKYVTVNRHNAIKLSPVSPLTYYNCNNICWRGNSLVFVRGVTKNESSLMALLTSQYCKKSNVHKINIEIWKTTHFKLTIRVFWQSSFEQPRFKFNKQNSIDLQSNKFSPLKVCNQHIHICKLYIYTRRRSWLNLCMCVSYFTGY